MSCSHAQRIKGKHLAYRKFPRRKTSRNSNRPTPDGAVCHPDWTSNMTSLKTTSNAEEELTTAIVVNFLVFNSYCLFKTLIKRQNRL